MQLDQIAADRQSQPGSMFAGANMLFDLNEAVKNLFFVIALDSGSIIADIYPNAFAAMFDFYCDFSRIFRNKFCCTQFGN